MEEDSRFLTKQIITYLGNKRSLLDEIGEYVSETKKDLKKDKLVCVDLFSGSGIVARYLKQHSSLIIANDLEKYSKVLNECYLSNKSEFDEKTFKKHLSMLNDLVKEKPTRGFVSNYYSPEDDKNIKADDRVFYTNKNALLIDSYRFWISESIPKKLQKYFLAQLIVEASVHVNTCGVFKGFYKDNETGIGKFGGSGENALKRIRGDIRISTPYLSNFESDYRVYQEDAVRLSKKLGEVDLVYLDPPYNQHPYGSNYFMLNLILKNKIDSDISRVSGIPKNWNRSDFNKKSSALKSMEKIVSSLKASHIIISYNNEGFISMKEMLEMLNKYGDVTTKQIKYNTFRGSHNLSSRKIHTKEYLFLLKKGAKK